LTVRKAEANSHKDHGWEMFTDSVIKAISANYSNVVFMLWGAYAQKKSLFIDTVSRRLEILTVSGPE
jgi:uracil-DNA glycosylase